MEFSTPGLTINDIRSAFGHKPPYLVGLDSATMAVQALGNYLNGKDLPEGGAFPSLKSLGGEALSYLPDALTATLSTWGGWINASSPDVVEDVRAETLSRWVLSQYPRQQYPAAMVGSANGAAVHFGAALGIPWLPQTLLVCLRYNGDPDEPRQAMERAQGPAQTLLRHNPDLWVYQMHDPNQDRVKTHRVIYFRLKQTRLGIRYKQFLQENLAPGGTIFLVECQFRWLATQVGDRHLFQFGGTGSLTPEEYYAGSPEIADFLERYGSEYRAWNPPSPDGWFPEAEWGFDDALRQDTEEFARQHGYRVQRIVFEHPQDFSPLVAELYRWWYKAHGIPGNRLISESFVYLQPWWSIRLGLVPFWAVFNDQRSAQALDSYLESAQPYDEIYINLFSNGIEALGYAPIKQWRSILSRARSRGEFIGVNEETYPSDLASFTRHYTELKQLEGKYPQPGPLTLDQLECFLAEAGDQYSVHWI